MLSTLQYAHVLLIILTKKKYLKKLFWKICVSFLPFDLGNDETRWGKKETGFN